MKLMKMKKLASLTCVMTMMIGTIAAAAAATQSYEFRSGDPSSRLELTVEKTGLLSGKKHIFSFSKFHGTLQFDAAKPEASTVVLTIESNGIVCEDKWLSAKDLRKVQDYALNDMLAAAQNPQITFRSTTVAAVSAGKYRVDGILTIKGVAKPASVAVSLVNPSGPADKKLSAEGAAQIKLTDFGLKPPKAALGAIGTKDEMSFRFSVQSSAAQQ